MKLNIILHLIIFICLFIIASNIVSAYPSLNITPNSFSTSTFRGNQLNQSFTLTNSGNMTMFNISITNVQNTTWKGLPNNISVGQSKIINAIIKADTFNAFPVMSFYYRLPIDPTQKTYNVSIGQSTYNPISITIKRNDSIRWTNNANQTRSATKTDFSFDFQLLPNQSATKQFTIQETVNYFSTQGLFGGSIIIQNELGTLTHNAGFDKVIPISITTTQAQSSASLQIFLTNIEMNYNEALSNALTITNTNLNTTANNLFLTGKWGNFNSSTYTLTPSQQKFIQFNVIPRNIVRTNQTNKTYAIQINLSGINIQPVQQSINVFIKYHRFNGSEAVLTNGTPFYFATDAQIKAYCKANPNSCPKTIQNQTIYAPMPTKVNVTSDTVQRAFENYANWTSSQQRFENIVNTNMLKITDMLSAQNLIIANMSAEQMIMKKKTIKLNKETEFNMIDLNEKMKKVGIITKMRAMKLITKMQMSLCKTCLKNAISQRSGNILYCDKCTINLNKYGAELNNLLSVKQ